MGTRGAKERVVIILDAGSTMREMMGDVVKADLALKTAKLVLIQKLLLAKSDEVCIITAGSQETNNQVNYPNISECYGGEFLPVKTATIRTLEKVTGLDRDFAPETSLLNAPRRRGTGGYGDEDDDNVEPVDISIEKLDAAPIAPGAPPTIGGDLFDSLILAVLKIMETSSASKAGKFRVLMITDGLSPTKDIEGELLGLVDKLAELKIRFDVVGVGFPNDLYATAALKLDINAPQRPEDEPIPIMTPFQTQSFLVGLSKETGGAAVSVQDALSSLSHMSARVVTPVTKFRGNLDIAGLFKIPVWTYSAVQPALVPSFKRLSLAAAEAELAKGGDLQGADDEDGEGEEGTAAKMGSGSTPAAAPAGGIRFERSYFRDPRARIDGGGGAGEGGEGGGDDMGYGDGPGRPTSDLGEAVDSRDIGKAFTFGRDTFHVGPAELESVLKWSIEKEMVTHGFVKAGQVPRYAIMGPTDIVIPAPGGGAKAERAVSAFARALVTSGTVPLVRHVRRKGGNPVLGVLAPALVKLPEPDETDSQANNGGTASSATQEASNPHAGARHPLLVPSPIGMDCLFFLPVPFEDDIRPFRFPPLNNDKHAPTRAQLAAVDTLITGLDLMHVPTPEAMLKGDGMETREILAPENTFNPVLQRYYEALSARCMDPDAPLPPLDEAVASSLRPDATLLRIAAKEVANLQAVFGPILHRPSARTTGLGAGSGSGGGSGSGYLGEGVGETVGDLLPSVSVPTSHPSVPVNIPADVGVVGMGRGRGGADPVLGHLRLWNELTHNQRVRLQGGETERDVIWGDGGGMVMTGESGDPTQTQPPLKRRRIDPSLGGTDATPTQGGQSVAGSEVTSLGGNVISLFSTGAPPRIAHVGTARPIDDFWALLDGADAEEQVVRAIEEMSRVIETLAADPIQQDKAVGAVMELRAGCLQFNEERRFNVFLRKIKAKFGPQPGATGIDAAGSALWRRLVSNSVSLISSEDSTSIDDVSPQDKVAFLTYTAPRPVAPPPRYIPPPVQEPSDDLDELE